MYINQLHRFETDIKKFLNKKDKKSVVRRQHSIPILDKNEKKEREEEDDEGKEIGKWGGRVSEERKEGDGKGGQPEFTVPNENT